CMEIKKALIFLAIFETGTICIKETNPTNAISKIYQQMCKEVTTKFSGPQIMSWNEKKIVYKLSIIDAFCPFYISLGELKIFIHSIGSSSQQNLKK
ncbi:11782_t:CDS:1, partial [Entrophospora sp. SA101]